MSGLIERVRKGFFWGPPSHRRIAAAGLAAGILVVAVPVAIALFGQGAPVLVWALAFVGLAEAGWGIELLPRALATTAGWGRLARWLCALVGLVLGAISVVGQLSVAWFTVGIAVTALALVFEMAPGSFANRA
ncbi:MAG TPA: hypothetical protein VGR57_08015 [Ktedonobacterales bacterium]|nr:hypothetical protein [Ktedonobacterales bacterium]